MCHSCTYKRSTFEELLEKEDYVSIQIKNLQTLATEMYKVVNGDSPEIIKVLRFRQKNRYYLRNQNTFRGSIANTVYGGTETLSFLGSKIWEYFPT